MLSFAFLFISCNIEISEDDVPDEKNGLTWTNDKAIYASIKTQHTNDVMLDVDGAFENLNFKAVFVVEKSIENNQNLNLTLLFILNNNQQQQFIDILLLDERINGAWKCLDLPFESIDNRYLDVRSNNIQVGEELDISIKGDCNIYHQPFRFEGIWVRPTNYDSKRLYHIDDFPQVNITSVEKDNSGRLYLQLEEPGYFNVIKAVDIMSRLDTINAVEVDYFEPVVPDIWQISDRSIADFAYEYGYENYNNMTTIIGLKPGEVTIGFNGVYCNITVTEEIEE